MLLSLLLLLVSAGEAFAQMSETDKQFERRRLDMVESQISAPRDSRPPVRDRDVIRAMQTVARHQFVAPDSVDLAYSDRPLPIGHQQTISQPYIVAYMTELLDVASDHRVLEIGTGSGYQAAILAELVEHVFTIEILEPLAEEAELTLRQLGYENITVKAGDGYVGWPEYQPFDRIIVTAAPDHVPKPLIEQLKPGGRMVIPVGPVWSTQSLIVIDKDEEGNVSKSEVMAVGFVPLIREE